MSTTGEPIRWSEDQDRQLIELREKTVTHRKVGANVERPQTEVTGRRRYRRAHV